MLRHRRPRAAENEYVLCHNSPKGNLLPFFELRKRLIDQNAYVTRKSQAGSFIRFEMKSPASRVPKEPPMSDVVWPSATAASTAVSIALDSSRAPSVSSISADDKMAPTGLATFFPASGGAD